ncbi:MAG: caspase family protein [Elusimicrobiota bacterium]|nr:caspase family protein [Elusimicrobiota bacterium]
MSIKRAVPPLVLCGALLSGCHSPLRVGERMTARAGDARLLDLCVFTPGSSVLERNCALFTMSGAVGAGSAAEAGDASRPLFRSAAYVRGLDDAAGCDVMLKIVGRNLVQAARPTELYAARSKTLLKRFDAPVTGPAAAYRQAAALLAPGGEFYDSVLAEAGAQRQAAARAAAAAADAPKPPAGGAAAGDERLSREDLRQLMAEAVKSASAPAAPASPRPSSDADTPRYKLAEDADAYAVVIGVEKYNGLPDAAHAERDAKAVYEHLLALGYPQRNIALLTGAQATRTGLVKNLEAWLPQNVGERSKVVFYYSGHGAPDPRGGAAYLVPADGDPQYLEETAYPVKRLYEKLAALKAKRVFVAMDSCFSGAGGRSVLAKGTRPLVGKVDLGAVGGKVVSLTASAADQISGTDETQGHGLFTYHLLRGLNGEAMDASGAVTAKSLHAYLTPKVRDGAKRANREQTPQLLPTAPAQDFRLR